MAKQPSEHGKTLVSERLVDEWFLPIERFGGATWGYFVFLVQLRINNFRVEFGDGW